MLSWGGLGIIGLQRGGGELGPQEGRRHLTRSGSRVWEGMGGS